MSNSFKIDGVEYFSQRDNAIAPSVSCFPTSTAMCMNYILKQLGKTKEDIGCAPHMQLEDYLNQVISSAEMTAWMKANQAALGGSWIWGYPPRTIYTVEAHAFNMLMNPFGYKATARTDLTYDTICSKIEQQKVPFVIGGNFSSVSSVQGHMNCLLGFNSVGIKEFIVHDPYGDALKGYQDKTGTERHYGTKFYLHGSNNAIWALVIEK